MRQRTHAAVLGGAVLVATPWARAGETTLAEPVIEENITDIDSREPRSIEFDLTSAAFRSTDTRAGLWRAGLETEWRPFDRAGIGLELETLGSLDGASPVGAVHVVPRGALSYVMLRDVERQVFLQLEAGGRFNDGESLALADPTEIGLPYWAGVREAMKLGPLDLRAAAFGEAGGTSAHAPVRASGAVLYSMVGESARGAFGAEVLADWSRASPFVLAPEAQILTRGLDRPMRFELAVPFTIGAKEEASYGVAVRIVLEPDE
jgi:hypothetical protein